MTHTFYLCDKDLHCLIKRLENGTAMPLEWFEDILLKSNHNEFYLFLNGYQYETG